MSWERDIERARGKLRKNIDRRIEQAQRADELSRIENMLWLKERATFHARSMGQHRRQMRHSYYSRKETR